jgi:hypothetical protein
MLGAEYMLHRAEPFCHGNRLPLRDCGLHIAVVGELSTSCAKCRASMACCCIARALWLGLVVSRVNDSSLSLGTISYQPCYQ